MIHSAIRRRRFSMNSSVFSRHCTYSGCGRCPGTLELFVPVVGREEELDVLIVGRHEVLTVEEVHEFFEPAKEFEEVPIGRGDIGEGASWFSCVT